MHGIEKRSLKMNLDPINVITFTSIPYVKSVSIRLYLSSSVELVQLYHVCLMYTILQYNSCILRNIKSSP